MTNLRQNARRVIVVGRSGRLLLGYFVHEKLEYVQEVGQIGVADGDLARVGAQVLTQEALEHKGHEELRALLYLTVGHVAVVGADEVGRGAHEQRLVDEQAERIEANGKGEYDPIGLLDVELVVAGERQPHLDAVGAAVEPQRVVEVLVEERRVCARAVAHDPARLDAVAQADGRQRAVGLGALQVLGYVEQTVQVGLEHEQIAGHVDHDALESGRHGLEVLLEHFVKLAHVQRRQVHRSHQVRVVHQVAGDVDLHQLVEYDLRRRGGHSRRLVHTAAALETHHLDKGRKRRKYIKIVI